MIHENGRHGSVLVIGHNPMMEDLAMAVSAPARKMRCIRCTAGFPTSGLAVIRFEGSLSDAELGSGYLEAFLTPADL